MEPGGVGVGVEPPSVLIPPICIPQLCSYLLLPRAGTGAEGTRARRLLQAPRKLGPSSGRGAAHSAAGEAGRALGPWRPPAAAIRGCAAPHAEPASASVPGVPTGVGPGGRCGRGVEAPQPRAWDGRASRDPTPPWAPWALPTPRPRRCGSWRARPAVSIPRGAREDRGGTGRPADPASAHSRPLGSGPPALCDLGLVAGSLGASVSPSFKWVPHRPLCGHDDVEYAGACQPPAPSELDSKPCLGLQTREGAVLALPARGRAGARSRRLGALSCCARTAPGSRCFSDALGEKF